MQEIKFKLSGKEYTTTVDEQLDGSFVVSVNGRTYSVPAPERKGARPGAKAGAKQASQAEMISAPLPGTITQVNATVGQKVKRGDVVVVMEAMKMANDIVAEHDGVITAVSAAVGQNVNQGDALMQMQTNIEEEHEVKAAVAAAPEAAPVAAAPAQHSMKHVAAPLPGTVKQILVKAGDEVKRGDVVVTMEAMKMENNICAEQNGRVKAVAVGSDQQVQQGDVLIEME